VCAWVIVERHIQKLDCNCIKTGTFVVDVMTDGQPVRWSDCLGVEHLFRAYDQILFFFLFFPQLLGSLRRSLSLTRDVIYSAATLWSELRRTHNIFCCFISDSPNLDDQVPVPRNRVAHIHSRASDFLSVASYDSQGYGGGIAILLYTVWFLCSSSSYFTTDGQPWCRAPISGPCPDFYYCRTFVVFTLRGAFSDETIGL
jgi:hypothetical protein